MRQTVVRPAKAVRKIVKNESLDRSATSPLKTKRELSGNEKDPATDFIVGALLYSLLVSHRSETVRALLPDSEENRSR